MNREEFDRFIKDTLDDYVKDYMTGGSLEAFMEAKVYASDNSVQMMISPDLSEQQFRAAVMKMCAEHGAAHVSVKDEAWFVEVPDDASEETKALVKKASQERTMHKLKPPLRREKVRVFVECQDFPIELYTAEIFREGDSVRLSPWEKMKLRMPSPEFKRYLLEKRSAS